MPPQVLGEREVLLGERLVHLLGERQLLVVALEHGHAEMAGGGGLEAGEVDDHRRHEHAGDAHPGQHRAPTRTGAQREPEVEQQPVDGDHHEAHEQRAADAGQGARRGDGVQRDAEVGPREPAEREAAPQRLQHHPHRGGEER